MPKEDGATRTAVTAGITGILIAVIPAAFSYAFSFVDGIRKDDLGLVDKQIEKLSGPLYALTQANDATWRQFNSSN